MRLVLLGPVRAWDGDRPVNLGVRQQRFVLAVLALRVNTLVPVARLVDLIWPDAPPHSARGIIHTHISRLRTILGRASGGPSGMAVLTEPEGYRLRCDPALIDAHQFQGLLAKARASDDAGERVALLDQALGLWDGPALAGIASEEIRLRLCHHLEQARLTAAEDRAEARLRLGRHHEVIDELTALSAEHPARQRVTALLMLALHRAGRTADALHAYERVRRQFAEELGVDPGTELQDLHRMMLRGDPGDAPPPRAARPARPVPVPAQLPADVSVFTGRGAELARLDTLLDGGEPTLLGGGTPATMVISAVSGTAGVGKTALAVHWAHRAADRFPDGQLYVNLRGYDPDQPMSAGDALARFLTALGVPSAEVPYEVDERAARYRTEIAGRRMLIVLDNAASVEQVRPLLPGTASCAVVVTSRDRLAGLVAVHGAHRVDLDLLPSADAVALLRRLIGPRVDAEADAAAVLAEQCGRLPLGLRVAAELAVSRPATPLADLVAELADQQRRLQLLDAGGDPRAAVTAVFSWSVRQLPPAAAHAFGLLGLHPGADFDAYAVAALTGTGLDQARRTLDGLARAHLVHPAGPGRFGMHDLLRAYAASLATAGHSRAALSRLFDYYLATTAAAMDAVYPAETHQRPRIPPPGTPVPDLADPDTAVRWLNTERPNLAAIAAHAATHGWPTHAVRLSTTLSRYLGGGHYTDALIIHTHAHHAAQQIGDRTGQARALFGLGTTHRQLCRYGPAVEHLQQALALFRQVGDQSGQARALNSLGIVEHVLGRYGLAAEHLQRALALFRRAGDRDGEARTLGNLGIIKRRLGHYQAATDYLGNALALYRRAGDRDGEANSLEGIARVEERLGRYRPAVEHLQQALALHRVSDNRSGEASCLDNLGTVHTRLGEPGQATEYLRQALTRYREFGERDGEASALNGLGEAAHATGRPADAVGHHSAALTIATQIGARDQQARAHTGLGHAHRALGDPQTARDCFAQALDLYTQLDMPDADEIRAHLATLDGVIQRPTVTG